MSAGQLTADWALVCHACGAGARIGAEQACAGCGGTLAAVPSPEVLAQAWTAG